ncbi:hypothetical protein BDV95DRAFT_587731 [Massariosphaeria phaeospora]|uniref:Rhodopsin domain-containing protein n=1 Tax=Massariosphaeria phaeospora TaxID=100035 RepID=A0A7C8M1N5_9PLEO|nr:hypothetical protein BDV95DRAFT_587731 [Massariosphaeria phaeospora]
MDFGPPPTPEFLAEDRYNDIFIDCTATFVLCFVCVILRLLSTRPARRSLWLDDGAAVLALIFAIGQYVGILYQRKLGFGKHIQAAILIDPNVAANFLKLTLSLEFVYISAITCVRFCILFFLWRIFGPTSMRKYLVTLLVVCGLLALTNYIGAALNCFRVNNTFDPNDLAKKCIDSHKFYVAIAIFNCVIDFSLMLLPVPYVLRLQISQRRKWMVVCSFAVAGLTCILSAIKVDVIINKFSTADPTWETLDLMKWSSLEIFCGIVAVCMPTFRPLLLWVWVRTPFHTPKTSQVSQVPDRTKASGHIYLADMGGESQSRLAQPAEARSLPIEEWESDEIDPRGK